MNKVVFATLMLVINCAPILGQEKPSWITQVENALREKERTWKISEKDTRGAGRYFHQTIILKAGALRADIIIDVLDSTELAKEQFAGEEIAFTNILEKGSVKSKLEGLGDENYMFTGKKGPRRPGNIFSFYIGPRPSRDLRVRSTSAARTSSSGRVVRYSAASTLLGSPSRA